MGEEITEEQLEGLLDLGTPSSPLFTLLGGSPESVFTPKTSRELSFALLPQAINAFGENQMSIGVEYNPGLAQLSKKGDYINLADYQDAAGQQTLFLSRFTLSAAAIRTAGDDAVGQYGLGLTYNWDAKSLLNNYRAYGACIDQAKEALPDHITGSNELSTAINKVIADSGIFPTDPTAPGFEEQLEKVAAVKTALRNAIQATIPFDRDKVAGILRDNGAVGDVTPYVDRLEKVHASVSSKYGDASGVVKQIADQCNLTYTAWNREVFSVGLAAYYSDVANGDDTFGAGVWASYAHPLGPKAQVIGSVRWADNLMDPENKGPAGTIEPADMWGAGLRLMYQFSGPDTPSPDYSKVTRGFVEAGYFDETIGDVSDDYWQAAIGAEIGLGNGTFLQFLVGNTFGSDRDRGSYLSAQFKW
ncbi:MAG: hypothetical protein CML68_14745 [Rhodobacteraceae bacterium]|nr:hypothetical protein [Paracoccaceae bacterium]